VPRYAGRVRSGHRRPGSRGAGDVRCCPGGISRSARVPRYPSDMSDAEWTVTEPTLPALAWKQGKGGRPAGHCRRDIVDAIRYLVKEGICWRAMPADFPPWPTCHDVLDGWQESGATEAMHHNLCRQCRLAAGRKSEPSAAIIDSQSVKGAETVSRQSRGFDVGKKANGRKRHIAVDTIGLLLTMLITAAAVQDRDAARPLLWNLRKACPAGGWSSGHGPGSPGADALSAITSA
jgi:transposase